MQNILFFCLLRCLFFFLRCDCRRRLYVLFANFDVVILTAAAAACASACIIIKLRSFYRKLGTHFVALNSVCQRASLKRE